MTSRSITDEYDLNGGRKAFRSMNNFNNAWDLSDARNIEIIMRQDSAMRSFTESVDADLPPAPVLPPSLDIDYQYPNESVQKSDTMDTIIERKTTQPDKTLGETQKYPMVVPGPGHVDAEQELHRSLLNREASSESDFGTNDSNQNNEQDNRDKKKKLDDDFREYRREYSVSSVQRPRPTTPTSWCAIESYVESFANHSPKKLQQVPEASAKMRVNIPGKETSQITSRHRRISVPWSDFYESMAAQMPMQFRSYSSSGKVNQMNDYDGDILDDDPLYKSIVPPVPVVHRRSSMDWENFEENRSQSGGNERNNQKIMEKNELGRKDSKIAEAFTITEVTTPDKSYVAPENTTDQTSCVISQFSMDEKTSKEIIDDDQKTMNCTEPSLDTNIIPAAFTSEYKASATATSDILSAIPTFTSNNKLLDQIFEKEVIRSQDHQEIGGQNTANLEECQDSWHENFGVQQTEYTTNSSVETDADQSLAQYSVTNQEVTAGPVAQAPGSEIFSDELGQPYYLGEDGQYYYFEQYGTSYYGTDSENMYSGYVVGYDAAQASEGEQNASGENSYDSGCTTQQYGRISDQFGHENQYYPPMQYDSEAVSGSKSDVPEFNKTGFDAHYEASGNNRPVVPQFIAPLLPMPEKTLDPFSWEAQARSTSYVKQLFTQPENQAPILVNKEKQSDQLSYYDHHQWEEQSQKTTPTKKPPPRPAAPRPAPPPVPALPKITTKKHEPSPSLKSTKSQPEEDAWTQFKKLTEKTNIAVKTTEEKLKELSISSAAQDIKDESYIAQIGGFQAYIPEMAQKQYRVQQEISGHIGTRNGKSGKRIKPQNERKSSLDATPAEQSNMDKAAEELAKKMAALRPELQNWKPPSERESSKGETVQKTREGKREAISQNAINELMESSDTIPFQIPKAESKENEHQGWAGFGESETVELAPSESGFFSTSVPQTCDEISQQVDPFAPNGSTFSGENFFIDDYDPFVVKSAKEFVEEAKNRAATEAVATEVQDDLAFFGGAVAENRKSASSTPTQEGGSPSSSRPAGFEDEFQVEDDAMSTSSPLYDEDDSQELTEFPAKFVGEGWNLMIRYPIKKKIMGDRYWKTCFVKLLENMLQIYASRSDQKPILEILLQATYSLSDTTLQAYDIYGKIHTVKLQYVLYKEKVGIRPGQISRLVEGHITKYGLPLEHSAQCTILLKFGSLNAIELSTFVTTIEDVLFKCVAKRDTVPLYKQDEIQIHCYDEYSAYVDKNNLLIDQKARVRLFCLAFVSGSPYLEIGLNDRRRQGKEIVRRKDILPMYTERWIRFENVEFHNTVDTTTFESEHVIKFSPPDGCFFEVMRFRVRPPKNREKPLSVKCLMKIAGSKIEIRITAMAAAQAEKSKGGKYSKRQVPCEDIQIRFPIPEAWIYLFREERHWGVGSVHAKVRRPGKVKNLKDRLMGAVQNVEDSLIEAAIGDAKYEHVYRALVWRIPRLPEKHHGAYKEHLLRCRFELSSFDLMPEAFLPTCDVEFTMPLAMISNTVVRSVSVEQHDDSDRVEKFVRYVAKCSYKFEIDYIQCSDLDMDTIMDQTFVNPKFSDAGIPHLHKPAFNPNEINDLHGGYGIDFTDTEMGKARPEDKNVDSSSDEEEEKNKMPIIQIDMKNYGY